MAVCGVVDHSMQGLRVTLDGETRMIWGPTLPQHSKPWREAFYAAKRAFGDTHVTLSLSNLLGLATFQDRPDEPGVLTLMREALDHGFFILLKCMGDGNGRPEEVNYDSGALGYYWVTENFQTIHDIVDAAGFKPYTIFSPGFDGVVPGWQPFNRVPTFAAHARRIVGDGYLAIELSAGYWCWSGEDDDWRLPEGKHWDTILAEGPIEFVPDDYYWQIAKRLLGPKFNRPADMPAEDDPGMYPGGPSVHQTPRGPYAVVWFEYDTYLRVRPKLDRAMSDATTAMHRAYIKALGFDYVC